MIQVLNKIIIRSNSSDVDVSIILLVLAIGFAGFTILYLLGKGYLN